MPDRPVPSVRPARAGDEDTLARIDRDTWSTLHAVSPAPEPPYQPFFDERHAVDDHLVAELAGAVVGYVRLGSPTPLASNAHVRQIQGLAVTDGARGTGAGRALVRAAVAEAGRRGARRITLRVLGHNAPARALYESEGFTVEGVQPEEFLVGGQYVDDVLMGRSL
ncbi:GNAT family N-acetyltransferase [Streptomyces uncialis]|uniref:Acetyltransferase n=1 Tax=Streptomyces uncialis TaxID=1048205 RepID=A0A1Q4V5Y5_9ACTN|nr:GNAT family N-acetyltransferase [Streptomyces uncialis]MCX4663383.1 GNAT family N-acetyltransferase [Streptomyces uncialis]OKH93231.1 acetyltransferase [Streptomyces uncialis]WTE10464.1 GNAT family N-acetyltransferase [Streptomyces uncialis]